MVERTRSPMHPTQATASDAPLVPCSDWRMEAVTVYRQAEHPDRAARCRDLAARVFELTGQRVVLDRVQHDHQRRNASVVIDGMCFRLQRRALCVVRACVSCGVGQFESGTIESRTDLGHALAEWEPRCADCGVDDEDWTHSF